MKQKKKMSIEDAIKIVDSRNEIPREDDWELANAANVLRQKIAKSTKIKKVSAKELKMMSVGDCCVFTEPETTKNAGATSQAFASRCGIKIKTTSCFLLIPATSETVKTVIVERLT